MTKNGPRHDVTTRIRALVPKIEEVLSISAAPGMSIAVIHKGETIYVEHKGFRDVEAGLVADNQTRYNINSMTKATIAALVGIEVSRGTLRWDSRVRDLLPDFRSSSLIVQEHATIIDFLSHRTGITNFDGPWLQSKNTVLMGRDQTLPFFATLKPVQEFRTSFFYNNWGYEITALVLEKVTGMTLSELLHNRIFGPLGMSRTSTSWQTEDGNVAKSYAVLDDLTPVEIPPPQLGQGTLMEAAGGVKSTIQDLIVWYKTWLGAISSQCDRDGDGTSLSPLKEYFAVVSNHARLPGVPLREQGYGAGWARAQLPGQLGRISQNVMLGEEPTVGKGANSRLIVYHHGSMPGSTSVVHLIPDTASAVIVLQNSLATIDTADFVGQMLVEALIDAPEPNDYVALSKLFGGRTLDHIPSIKADLEQRRKFGTKPKSLNHYKGTYWNIAQDFRIDVEQNQEKLQMRFQRRDDEIYALHHYQDDIFCWLMSHNEAASRGRYINDFGAAFYLIQFCFEDGSAHSVGLKWAWDPEMPDTPEYFRASGSEA